MAFASFAFATAHAADEADLSGRPRGFSAKSAESANATAPFVAHVDPAGALPLSAPAAATERGVPCADGLSTLCYDARNRGFVYRGAREYMPRMQGFTPEGVALRHDRLILRYSFR